MINSACPLFCLFRLPEPVLRPPGACLAWPKTAPIFWGLAREGLEGVGGEED